MEKNEDFLRIKVLDAYAQNTPVKLFGAHHEPIVLRENEDVISQGIRDCGVVAVEGAYQGNYYYESIIKMAQEEGKRVFRVDPRGDLTVPLDVYQTVAGGALIVGSVASPENISRREALVRIGGCLGGALLVNGSMIGRTARSLVGDREEIMEGKGYGALDFRNCVIADALGLLTEATDGPIAAFYGRPHVKPIKDYLDKPASFLRRIGYLPYLLFTAKNPIEEIL